LIYRPSRKCDHDCADASQLEHEQEHEHKCIHIHIHTSYPRRDREGGRGGEEEGKLAIGRPPSPSLELISTQSKVVRSLHHPRPAHTLPQAHLWPGQGWQDPTAVLVSCEPDNTPSPHLSIPTDIDEPWVRYQVQMGMMANFWTVP